MTACFHDNWIKFYHFWPSIFKTIFWFDFIRLGIFEYSHFIVSKSIAESEEYSNLFESNFIRFGCLVSFYIFWLDCGIQSTHFNFIGLGCIDMQIFAFHVNQLFRFNLKIFALNFIRNGCLYCQVFKLIFFSDWAAWICK